MQQLWNYLTRKEVVAPAGVLLGTIVGAFAGFGGTWLTKRSEERRHLREIAVTAAIENHKIKHANAGPNEMMPPLEDFIAHMLMVVQIASKRTATPGNMTATLAEIRRLTAELQEYYKTTDPIAPKPKS